MAVHDSRQQRRRALRERTRAGEKAMRTGMPPTPPSPTVLAIATVIKAKLSERDNPKRAGEAAALAHTLAEASLKSFPARVEIACKRGCNYCCHTFVEVRAPEVFRIVHAVRASRDPDLEASRVIARGRPLHGLSVADRIGRKLACPLLVAGECGVYAARPLVCRQATSLSLAACIDEFENPNPEGEVEISSAHVVHASNAGVLLVAALKAMALPCDAYQLSEALEIALSVPDSEARWLAGDDIFSGIKTPPKPDTRADDLADRIAIDLNA